jgi:uncharacterized protein
MTKTVCIFHSVDLDGWMSAAIIKHWFISNNVEPNLEPIHTKDSVIIQRQISKEITDTLDFIGYNYGQPIPDVAGYDTVIMCDISFPATEMEKLRSRLQDHFIWCDHHISAMNAVQAYANENDLPAPHGLQDVTFSGCELTWLYFFPNDKMPEIVRLLGRYDCFGHKGTDEEFEVLAFQYGARSVISNYEEAYTWLASTHQKTNIDTILHIGNSIYQFLCTDAKQSYKNGFPLLLHSKPEPLSEPVPISEHASTQVVMLDLKEYKFICINKERFNPINFGIDYHADGYDGAACFHIDKDGIFCFSLYNDNGLVDCSQIAKTFSGGGHRGASGFRITLEQFNKLINNN